jgi:biopolymer transport protein ExbB
MFSLIQLQADTIANAASNVVIEKIATTNEISVLEFILKGGFFLIPNSILFI